MSSAAGSEDENLVRILVVDDERSLLMTLAANLELEGFEVVEASSPQLALELVETQKFDLVLSDIRMPAMSGVELFHHVRASHPEMPFVLMTAFALESLVNEAIEHGVFAVLPKPFAIDHLVSILSRAGRAPVVLVVDDAPRVAESTVEALRAAGLRARAVLSGEAAVQAVGSGDVDVAIVDLVMPGIDGAEAIRQIREIEPEVACIAVSGHDAQEMLRRVASSGAVACMRKPIATSDLLHAIALARRGRAPAS